MDVADHVRLLIARAEAGGGADWLRIAAEIALVGQAANADDAALEAAAEACTRHQRLDLAERMELARLALRRPAATADFDAQPTELRQAQLIVRVAGLRVRMGKLQSSVALLKEAPEGPLAPHAELQLGNALRYLGDFDTAGKHVSRAHAGARTQRDRRLAIAALCLEGELALLQDQPPSAAACFGRALGLTELSRDREATTLPLAGLAHAHALWRNPAKGAQLALRACARAREAQDPLGEARALLALAVSRGGIEPLADAEALLADNVHEPLRLRVMAHRVELQARALEQLPEQAQEGERLAAELFRELSYLRTSAASMGMAHEYARLNKLAQGLGAAWPRGW